MSHPADSPSWKLLDDKWPEFGNEPRNLRLALSSDGFNPHSSLSSRYSCWPVILVTYNLPPWLCMKRKFMMLTLLISGPKQPGNDIDVYLEPLIDDLKSLWVGIRGVYDAHNGEYFTLRAALMWTINDFPAYGNLSGCVVKGYKACPICGDDTPSHRLKNGHKICYIGHRKWLPVNHPYRRQRAAFNGKPEYGIPPEPLTGEEVLHMVENGDRVCWKKKSIFFDLEYWKYLPVRHTLDVMHIEKNVCDSIIGTLLEIPGKNKDGIAARLDLLNMGVKTDLQPEYGERRTRLPPGPWNLSKAEKREVCNSFYGMKVPEGYSSNIKNLVSLQDSRLLGLKSHDCHTLMQQLLPVAIRSVLEKPARYAITRLCFFFNAICAKTVDVSKLDKLEEDVVVTLCLLEKYFPPSFFDIMVHLVVHLVREVRLCGPVYFRWMYPFERYMKVLKGYVQNRTRPEGCIAERQKMGVSKPLSGCTNTEEVLPCIEQHMIHIKTAYPKFRKRTKWLQDKHNSTFIQWLRFKVQSELEEDNHGVSENLRWLAAGPNMAVPLYRSYLIKGIKFNIKAQDDVRTTQNSGVYLLAHTMQVASAKDKNPILSNIGFYGVIQEIWDLDYQKFTIPVFRCDWIDSSGLVVDELGFTLVDLSKIGHRNDQFVLASQVKQIFFVDDPMHRGWSVVLSMPNREYNDVIGDEVLDDVIIECEPFTRGMPNVDTFDELIGNTNSREDKVCLKFSILVASNEWKHIKIEDDDDVNFFMKYNSEVTPSKLASLLVSIEDKGLTNDVVHRMHITTDSSWMGHSSVAIVESNEVTWNNTNVTDLGGEVGTDFMDMIDFSEVEEMHGGDNGTERNEVSVYSAPPNLGCLNTAAQLPIMRLGGESEPTRQHYWSQMGEQNRYNAVGVNDEEAYLDSGFSRSDWNPKITVGQIFSSHVNSTFICGGFRVMLNGNSFKFA
ncbi:hypothetical protein L3X38_024406 [Prunus dulcis]|uniref:Transposable element protein n=1 Tax=Prunus dulcis TaxID=3755 RepID=A0AAD4W0V4_PRUDU|nr:hypothetical protein L3X38_024406 [Prunus dulcis]